MIHDTVYIGTFVDVNEDMSIAKLVSGTCTSFQSYVHVYTHVALEGSLCYM